MSALRLWFRKPPTSSRSPASSIPTSLLIWTRSTGFHRKSFSSSGVSNITESCCGREYGASPNLSMTLTFLFRSTQRLIETGLVSLSWRPGNLISLIVRAAESVAVYETLFVDEEEAIALIDLKGVFTCLLFGLTFSSFLFAIKLVVPGKTTREIVPNSNARVREPVIKRFFRRNSA